MSSPDTAILDEIPAKKRRGRPPKRKDPAEAPIDGDYTEDVILGKDPAFRYALLSEDDIPKFGMLGYEKVERTKAGGPRPAWDRVNNSESDYKVKNLTLYRIPEEIAQRYDARNKARSEAMMKSVSKKHGAAQQGRLTQELVR